MKVTRQLIANTLVIVGLVIVSYFFVRRVEGFVVSSKDYFIKEGANTTILKIPASDLAGKGTLDDIEYAVYKGGAWTPMTNGARIDMGGTTLTYKLGLNGTALRKKVGALNTLPSQTKLPTPVSNSKLASGFQINNISRGNFGTPDASGDANGKHFKVTLKFI